MTLFSHKQNTTAGAGAPTEVDPMYNEVGQGAAGGGNQDPANTRHHGGVLKRGAEGAALGGVVGHEGHHGHAKRDAALLGAGGAAYEHEHNKHQNQSHNLSHKAGYGNNTGLGNNTEYGNTGGMTSGGGMGANQPAGTGMGVTSNQGGAGANMPNTAEAKKLQRSGKIDKIVGTLIGSTKLKQEGIQKQADAVAITEQGRHLDAAQQLEAEAQMRRGHAIGLGAHPSHATRGGGGGMTGLGGQPGYGTTGTTGTGAQY